MLGVPEYKELDEGMKLSQPLNHSWHLSGMTWDMEFSTMDIKVLPIGLYMGLFGSPPMRQKKDAFYIRNYMLI